MLSGHRPQGALRAEAIVVGASRSPNMAHQPHWPEVLAGAVTTATIESDHYALLQHPQVNEVAALLVKARRVAEPAL